MLTEDRVLYEDNHLILVNKLPSEIVQGDRSGDRPLSEEVKDYLKEKYAKPGNVYLGVTHRLDRPTSGAVVFAKTGKALSRMNQLFRDGKVVKIYWAIVVNRPYADEGTLTDTLIRNHRQNKSYVARDDGETGKSAELDFKLLAESERYFLLEIRPRTGRHHQIRTQLAHIGCPIKGDLKYGAPRSDSGGGIHLHARFISFPHPAGRLTVAVTAPVPSERLWDVMQSYARAATEDG